MEDKYMVVSKGKTKIVLNNLIIPITPEFKKTYTNEVSGMIDVRIDLRSKETD